MAQALTRAMDWSGDRGRYAIANGVIILFWVALLVVVGLAGSEVNPFDTLIAPAILWNLASYKRTAEIKLYFLHLAPYLTIIGCRILFWAYGAEQRGTMGLPPLPPWQQNIQYLGWPFFLAWIVATLTLLTFGGRRRGSKA